MKIVCAISGIVAIYLFVLAPVLAQSTSSPIPPDAKPKFEWRMEGQIGVFTNGEAIFVNFGGPTVRLRKQRFTLGYFVAPTLRFWQDAPRPFIVPTVGTGIEIAYKKIGIAGAIFYNNAGNEWMPAGGMVYKF